MKTKKAAKKQTPKSKKKGPASTSRATRFNPDAKILVLTRANPRRPKTVQHDRYAVILRHHGKTVGTFVDHKGDTAALRYAVEGGHARVK